mmetsp:Transcript_13318/g.24501  ORF Transcript_13318/g.24501 Transcript_13318/m.24501 type:complete len:160 (-) Transcript_13318:68-547(-)
MAPWRTRPRRHPPTPRQEEVHLPETHDGQTRQLCVLVGEEKHGIPSVLSQVNDMGSLQRKLAHPVIALNKCPLQRELAHTAFVFSLAPVIAASGWSFHLLEMIRCISPRFCSECSIMGILVNLKSLIITAPKESSLDLKCSPQMWCHFPQHLTRTLYCR